MKLPPLRYEISPPNANLLAVDRAVSDLRRGAAIGVTDDGTALLIQAAEAAADDSVHRLAVQSGSEVRLILTANRAAAIGILPVGGAGEGARSSDAPVVGIRLRRETGAAVIRRFIDPIAAATSAGDDPTRTQTSLETGAGERAAIALAKLGGLLPAALVARVRPLEDGTVLPRSIDGVDLIVVPAKDALAYEQSARASLRPVAEANVPLADAAGTRIVAFRPSDGGREHLAIVIGDPSPDDAVLVRLHSECFTGDLLGSLRCDCGPQLQGAIKAIAAEGSGIVLYLAQEGRGIGLINKLRAYTLQDAGDDTFEANTRIGFEDDERLYDAAAEILHQLGIRRVRLLTNNPDKLARLAEQGIEVEARVAHRFAANPHNAQYLKTKAQRGGHLA